MHELVEEHFSMGESLVRIKSRVIIKKIDTRSCVGIFFIKCGETETKPRPQRERC
jgi:hypothetical protein